MESPSRLQAALRTARAALLAERNTAGHWTGELSSSALSTATAVTALQLASRELPSLHPRVAPLIAAGLEWLARHVNPDGGWGDTIRSRSNISTTTLGWCAFAAVPDAVARHEGIAHRASEWLARAAGGLDPARLAPAITARYGKDRTFSVPILTMAAVSGRLGAGPEAWRHVPQLPFELAALPQGFFAALRLPVVSYALPALISMGQARHRHRPTRNPVTRLLRNAARRKTLAVLDSIQPDGGGFLEATPLTSFVVMSLVAAGEAFHPVTSRGVEFLIRSARADGSWPIDTNLATWVSTLAVNALSAGGTADPSGALSAGGLHDWLLGQQYRKKHPYTGAAPGGWAWTDLPGGVPDADDTPGALLALHHLAPDDPATREAAASGVRWLLGVQNRDGGIPTFCRGWTNLPFDRSSADLTAHTLRAWAAWHPAMPGELQSRIDRASGRALVFLAHRQRDDGSWLPLWFGNQDVADDENPLYATARCVTALAQFAPFAARRWPGLRHNPLHLAALQPALTWLLKAQNPDGGWGGAAGVASSVEETSLAVEALADARICGRSVRGGECTGEVEIRESLRRGADWLVARVEDGRWREPSPIGFYFAKLWYFERLYPVIFTAAALGRAVEALGER